MNPHPFPPSPHLLTALLISLVGLAGGCNNGLPGNGKSQTRNRPVEDFHAVSMQGTGAVNVMVGKPRSVTVTVDENLMQYVETTTTNGTLQIRNSQPLNPKVNLVVDISVPRLDAGHVTGVGNLKITDLTGKSVELSVSGVGSLWASGIVESAEVDVSGVGNADLAELKASSVEVTVSGTGGAEVYASDRVKARVSGVGDIVVHGHPKDIDQSSTGIGKVVIRK